MTHWISRNRKELVLFPALMVLVTLYVHACAPGDREDLPGTVAAIIDCSAGFGNHSINCPALPDTPPGATPANDTAQASLYEDWAWKSFVAANWPAASPNASTTPAYARGFPDYGTHFGLGKPNATPVWGTWKEKRELFSVDAQTPLPWNSEYDYFVEFPACTAADGELIDRMPVPRLFAQSSKGPANSFDETVQVPSEARYPAQVAHASVQPRIWRLSREDQNTIVYEVKLNYDYFTYVADNQLYNDTVRAERGANSGDFGRFSGHDAQSANAISFPRRLAPPANGTPFNASTNYSAEYCEQQNRPLGPGRFPPNPCLTGTIQTKSAWVLLSRDEIESGTYHWTEAQFFRSVPVSPQFPEGICTAHGNFGLLGFHIIQKTVNQGFYVYATFEHAKNDDTTFVYANYFRGNSSIPAGFYPAVNDSPNAITVARDHPVFASTTATTKAYHDLISAVNPSSVWLNYNLTGVQFLPVQGDSSGGGFSVGSDDPTDIGQPFYLANLVIETNWGLQNFQGVPPGKANGNVPAAYTPTKGFTTGNTSTDHYLPNPTIDFDRSFGNIGHSRRFGGRVYRMGGCVGCHGIAQADGTDFSFVLLLGQGGANVDTINAPPE